MSARTNAPGPQGLRPLGVPQPVQVHCGEDGEPIHVAPAQPPKRGGGLLQSAVTVERVEEMWRISEAWWREKPIARTYFRLSVAGGRSITIFRDDLADGPRWFIQRY